MIQFTPGDAMECAVQIEENGETFYRRMAEKFDDPEVKKLFTYLLGEETKHKKTYAKMLSKLEKYQTVENYPEEYYAYLRAYVEKVIFSPERLEEEMGRIKDKEAAIDFAIRAELESIMYYEEMKKLVREKDQDIIEKIIEEERKHFLELSALSMPPGRGSLLNPPGGGSL
jgi:rubrerythrin